MAGAREKGFSAVEGVIVLVVVLVVGFAGFMLVKHPKGNDTASNADTAATSTDSDVPAAPAVTKTSDLDTAVKILDNTNLDAAATDTADLDTQLSGF